jgi:hypothetical protein
MIIITELDTTNVAPRYTPTISHCLYRCVYTSLVPFTGALFCNSQLPNDHVLSRCNAALYALVIQRTSLLMQQNTHITYATDIMCFKGGVLVTIHSTFPFNNINAMVQYRVINDNLHIDDLTLNQVML